MVRNSCSTSGSRRIDLVTNPVIGHQWGKNRGVFTSGTYPWLFVTQIFHNGQSCHGGNRKTYEVMTSAKKNRNFITRSKYCRCWILEIYIIKILNIKMNEILSSISCRLWLSESVNCISPTSVIVVFWGSFPLFPFFYCWWNYTSFGSLLSRLHDSLITIYLCNHCISHTSSVLGAELNVLDTTARHFLSPDTVIWKWR